MEQSLMDKGIGSKVKEESTEAFIIDRETPDVASQIPTIENKDIINNVKVEPLEVATAGEVIEYIQEVKKESFDSATQEGSEENESAETDEFLNKIIEETIKTEDIVIYDSENRRPVFKVTKSTPHNRKPDSATETIKKHILTDKKNPETLDILKSAFDEVFNNRKPDLATETIKKHILTDEKTPETLDILKTAFDAVFNSESQDPDLSEFAKSSAGSPSQSVNEEKEESEDGKFGSYCINVPSFGEMRSKFKTAIEQINQIGQQKGSPFSTLVHVGKQDSSKWVILHKLSSEQTAVLTSYNEEIRKATEAKTEKAIVSTHLKTEQTRLHSNSADYQPLFPPIKPLSEFSKSLNKSQEDIKPVIQKNHEELTLLDITGKSGKPYKLLYKLSPKQSKSIQNYIDSLEKKNSLCPGQTSNSDDKPEKACLQNDSKNEKKLPYEPSDEQNETDNSDNKLTQPSAANEPKNEADDSEYKLTQPSAANEPKNEADNSEYKLTQPSAANEPKNEADNSEYKLTQPSAANEPKNEADNSEYKLTQPSAANEPKNEADNSEYKLTLPSATNETENESDDDVIIIPDSPKTVIVLSDEDIDNDEEFEDVYKCNGSESEPLDCPGEKYHTHLGCSDYVVVVGSNGYNRKYAYAKNSAPFLSNKNIEDQSYTSTIVEKPREHLPLKYNTHPAKTDPKFILPKLKNPYARKIGLPVPAYDVKLDHVSKHISCVQVNQMWHKQLIKQDNAISYLEMPEQRTDAQLKSILKYNKIVQQKDAEKRKNFICKPKLVRKILPRNDSKLISKSETDLEPEEVSAIVTTQTVKNDVAECETAIVLSPRIHNKQIRHRKAADNVDNPEVASFNCTPSETKPVEVVVMFPPNKPTKTYNHTPNILSRSKDKQITEKRSNKVTDITQPRQEAEHSTKVKIVTPQWRDVPNQEIKFIKFNLIKPEIIAAAQSCIKPAVAGTNGKEAPNVYKHPTIKEIEEKLRMKTNTQSLRRRPGYEIQPLSEVEKPSTNVGKETISDSESDIEVFEIGHTTNGESIEPLTNVFDINETWNDVKIAEQKELSILGKKHKKRRKKKSSSKESEDSVAESEGYTSDQSSQDSENIQADSLITETNLLNMLKDKADDSIHHSQKDNLADEKPMTQKEKKKKEKKLSIIQSQWALYTKKMQYRALKKNDEKKEEKRQKNKSKNSVETGKSKEKQTVQSDIPKDVLNKNLKETSQEKPKAQHATDKFIKSIERMRNQNQMLKQMLIRKKLKNLRQKGAGRPPKTYPLNELVTLNKGAALYSNAITGITRTKQNKSQFETETSNNIVSKDKITPLKQSQERADKDFGVNGNPDEGKINTRSKRKYCRRSSRKPKKEKKSTEYIDVSESDVDVKDASEGTGYSSDSDVDIAHVSDETDLESVKSWASETSQKSKTIRRQSTKSRKSNTKLEFGDNTSTTDLNGSNKTSNCNRNRKLVTSECGIKCEVEHNSEVNQSKTSSKHHNGKYSLRKINKKYTIEESDSESTSDSSEKNNSEKDEEYLEMNDKVENNNGKVEGTECLTSSPEDIRNCNNSENITRLTTKPRNVVVESESDNSNSESEWEEIQVDLDKEQDENETNEIIQEEESSDLNLKSIHSELTVDNIRNDINDETKMNETKGNFRNKSREGSTNQEEYDLSLGDSIYEDNLERKIEDRKRLKQYHVPFSSYVMLEDIRVVLDKNLAIDKNFRPCGIKCRQRDLKRKFKCNDSNKLK